MEVTRILSKFEGYDESDKIEMVKFFLSQHACNKFSVRFCERTPSNKDIENYLECHYKDNNDYQIFGMRVSKEVIVEYLRRDCMVLVAEFTDYEER